MADYKIETAFYRSNILIKEKTALLSTIGIFPAIRGNDLNGIVPRKVAPLFTLDRGQHYTWYSVPRKIFVSEGYEVKLSP
jgi:hypothetical protein